MQLYILRYGEIGTKSDNIRRNFVDILIQNIERTFLKYGKEVFLEKERGRIYAFTDKNSAYLFSRIFGIVSYSPVRETSSEISSIKEVAEELAPDLSGTFAVRARRTGEQDYTSPEAASEVGAAILKKNPDLKVDLDEPDHEVWLEIRGNKAYIFQEIIEGPGGLPLSSQGKVVTFIGSRDDFLATWLIMKRGARAYVYHKPDEVKWIEGLDRWDPGLKIIGQGDIKKFISYDFPEEVEGIVLGDSIDYIRHIEIDLPVFRPLIAFTEERKKEHLQRIKILSESDMSISYI